MKGATKGRWKQTGEDILDTLNSRLSILFSVLIDGCLLVGGAIALWGMQRVNDRLHLDGIVHVYWVIIELLLSAGSVAIVLLYIINDIRRQYRRLFVQEEEGEG